MFPRMLNWKSFGCYPPVQKMKSLTGDNWMQVAAHPEATDLQYLETLRISIPTEKWFGSSYDCRQLLQRCRALKNLDILPLGQSSFAWAVQEKRDHEGRIIANKGQGVVAWEEDPLPHSLVPLKNFTIEVQQKPLMDEVDDVAFAFSQTPAAITVTTTGTDTKMRWIQSNSDKDGWIFLCGLDSRFRPTLHVWTSTQSFCHAVGM
ncbi:hypothetical protein KI688_010489 [Linnemannia hyalina]|uniref:Uncharacterized protein n=1 Tax=Linnemannia hyalina TaxID=64524 RepID=A0A9P7XY99_9FUNG|nr:hypothetical protein KI688_010489 [Linnemannia hyalina]